MTPHCDRRDLQNRCCFFDGEPAEVSQLNDLALIRKNFSQVVHRFIERDYFRRAFLGDYRRFVESLLCERRRRAWHSVYVAHDRPESDASLARPRRRNGRGFAKVVMILAH